MFFFHISKPSGYFHAKYACRQYGWREVYHPKSAAWHVCVEDCEHTRSSAYD